MYANKKILITGGSSGLGKTLALSYAKEKGQIINLSRNMNKLKTVNVELQKINDVNHKYYSIDVSKYKDMVTVKKEQLKCLGYCYDIYSNPRQWLQFADDTSLITSIESDRPDKREGVPGDSSPGLRPQKGAPPYTPKKNVCNRKRDRNGEFESTMGKRHNTIPLFIRRLL